jgi:hypothetical protein
MLIPYARIIIGRREPSHTCSLSITLWKASMQVQKITRSLSSVALVLLVTLATAACVTPTKVKKDAIFIPTVSNGPLTEDRRSLIIYPQGFEESARAFAYLHREFAGIEARLVSLTEIAATQIPGPELRRIPYAGWDNQRPERITIEGYDFPLSKKIISYLQQASKSEKLLAVLLLGDGGLIPPSYYFHLPFLKNVPVDNRDYNEWIASDLLYSSPDLDLHLEWAVGRISVDTPQQAMAVAEKYYRWNLEKRKRQADSFIFFSGNIRNDLVYSGELLYQMFEQEQIVGANAKHFFQSDGRYTIDQLRKSFISDPGNIHYIFTHGTGDGFEIDGDYLHSEELAEMPYKPGLPLIVSPACLDGGFDYDLIDVPHDRDGYSIGEAILRSEGAGIGYLGSSRVSLGQFHYSMADGLVDAEGIFYRYMPGLINDFLRAWHNGNHRIADAYVEAHQRYRQRFSKFDTKDLATFAELNLLADPVMSLPEPQKSPNPPDFAHLVLTSPHLVKQRKPYVPPGRPVVFTLQPTSPHSSTQVSVVEAKSGEVLVKNAPVDRSRPLTIAPQEKTSYLMRLDLPDNTISWQFFHSGSERDFQ